MKELRFFIKAALLSIAFVLVSGCETAQWSSESRRYFNEAEQADVVLRFARWDYISISRPEYRRDGFLQQLRREQLSQAFDQLGARRDTAIVVVGWTYQDEVLNQVVSDWRSVLKQCGFRRMVCLRGGDRDNINGLPVLDDSSLAANAFRL
jgi:hypothetical protein